MAECCGFEAVPEADGKGTEPDALERHFANQEACNSEGTTTTITSPVTHHMLHITRHTSRIALYVRFEQIESSTKAKARR
jgi:hypothetical protein